MSAIEEPVKTPRLDDCNLPRSDATRFQRAAAASALSRRTRPRRAADNTLALLAPNIVEAILAGQGGSGNFIGKAGAAAAGQQPWCPECDFPPLVRGHEPMLQLGPVLELPRYRPY